MFAPGCSHELFAALGNFLFHGSSPSYFVPEKTATRKWFWVSWAPDDACRQDFLLAIAARSEKFDPGVHKAKESRKPKVLSVFHCLILAFLDIEGRQKLGHRFHSMLVHLFKLPLIKALVTSHLFCTYPISTQGELPCFVLFFMLSLSALGTKAETKGLCKFTLFFVYSYILANPIYTKALALNGNICCCYQISVFASWE